MPFGERKEGLELEAVFSESLRCMTCGSKSVVTYTDDCMTCFVCERLCPAGAIFVHPFKEKLPPVFPGPRYDAVEGNDLRDKEVYHA